MGIYFKMYYVGQGSLNLLWVKENDGSVPYAALFDAGSNSDPMRKRMESLVEVAGILNNFKQDTIGKFTFADTVKAGIYEDSEIDFKGIVSAFCYYSENNAP